MSGAQRDAQPVYFQHEAAQAAIQRRRLAQELRTASPRKRRAPLAGSAGPGTFVGQVVLSMPGHASRRLSDPEFLTHLEVSERCLQCMQSENT